MLEIKLKEKLISKLVEITGCLKRFIIDFPILTLHPDIGKRSGIYCFLTGRAFTQLRMQLMPSTVLEGRLRSI